MMMVDVAGTVAVMVVEMMITRGKSHDYIDNAGDVDGDNHGDRE